MSTIESLDTEDSLAQQVIESIENTSSLRAWVVCLTASLFFFYEFIQMNMFSSITPQLMRDFHLNAAQLGILSATYLFADVTVLLPAGLILDRFSTRTVILSALLVCIIGTGGFAVSHSFYPAAFFHFLSGIGNGFCFLSCMMLATRWFAPKRRAFVIGVIVTMAMLGGIVAQEPFALLTKSVGWRHTLFWDTLMGVGIFALIWYFVSDAPNENILREERQHQANQKIPFWTSLFLVMQNRQNWCAGIYTSLLNLPIMLLGALWGGLYLTQIHHIPMTHASFITTMIFAGTIVGSPFLGWLSDRLAYRRKIMVVGAVLSLAVMMSIMMLPHLSYTALLSLFFLLGLFTSSQVIAYPLVAESSPTHLTGASLGLTSLLIMGGAAIAQPLFGYLMDLHWSGTLMNGARIYTAENFHLALSIIPIGFIIGFLAINFAKETYCKNLVASDQE